MWNNISYFEPTWFIIFVFFYSSCGCWQWNASQIKNQSLVWSNCWCLPEIPTVRHKLIRRFQLSMTQITQYFSRALSFRSPQLRAPTSRIEKKKTHTIISEIPSNRTIIITRRYQDPLSALTDFTFVFTKRS